MTEAEELELLELEHEAAQAAPQHAPPEAKAAQRVGAGETFLNKTADAIPLGRQFSNALTALGLSAFGPTPGARLTPSAAAQLGVAQQPESPGLADNYRAARERFAARTEAGADQNRLAAGLGTGVGTALSLLAPLPKASVGSGATGRVLSNALTGAGYGALNGAANSRGDLTRGEVGQVLGDAVGVEGLQRAGADAKGGNLGRALLDVMGAGGVGGGLVGGSVGGLVEGARALAPGINRFANRKALNALGAMKPELNALGSEGAQAMGQFANDAGIVSPLASRATMAERIEKLRRAAGDKLSGTLGELDAMAAPTERINSADVARRVEALAEETASKPALRNIANKFRNEAENIRASAIAGEAPGGATLQDFEETVARPYKQTTNWNADLALPKETLKRLPQALEAEVERVAGGIADRTGSDALTRYRAAKQDYGKLAELRDIAEQGLRRQGSNHSISLKDAVMAAPAAALGMGHGGSLSGLAYGAGGLALSKLANRFGDQLGASGARAVSRALATPEGAPGASKLLLLLENAMGSRPSMSSAFADNADAAKQQALAQALRGDAP